MRFVRAQLLNTTVASIALTVNEVLTATYRAIYGASDDDELILVTAPLTATAEVQALYAGGLIDYETAVPAALHSLGCTSQEIASALERRREADEKEKALQAQRDSTEVDELRNRSKVAKLPVTAETAAPSKPAAKAAAKAPAKPQSDAGGDDD